MKILSLVREFLWPLLEKATTPIQSNDWNEVIATMDDSALASALEYAQKQLQSEEDRNKIVESKSIVFIGAISVVCTMLIGSLTLIVRLEERKLLAAITVVLLLVTTTYFIRTIYFSIKALERRPFARLSPAQYLFKSFDSSSKRIILASIIKNTEINSSVINEKVNSMVMAQEYFKRGLGGLILTFLVLTALFLAGFKF